QEIGQSSSRIAFTKASRHPCPGRRVWRAVGAPSPRRSRARPDSSPWVASAAVPAILGLNVYHGDASAALVVDGELVAAAEEERFNRVKHCAGFPALAARWCLDDAGLKADEIDHVAVSRDPRANLGRKLLRTIRHGA